VSTSMLDALAAEAKEITLLGAEASRLAIEAVRRSNLLTKQIALLAKEEEAAPPAISADATNEEFEQFQAAYFPEFLAFLGPKVSNSPGDMPAAQDSGAGNQGSDASAPGGVVTRKYAESEQAVADMVSGEQGLTVVCKDPETGPDARGTLSNRVLDLYANTDYDPREIAKKVGSTAAAVNEFIRQGRKNQNRLAAQGDLRRDIGVEVALAARSGSNRPKPADLPVPAAPESVDPGPASDGEICRIDLTDCIVTHGERSVKLARHEMRMVLALNGGDHLGVEQMMRAAKVLTGRSVDRELGKVNPRLAQIGVQISKVEAGTYQLTATA
jgi:hypothetical protein